MLIFAFIIAVVFILAFILDHLFGRVDKMDAKSFEPSISNNIDSSREQSKSTDKKESIGKWNRFWGYKEIRLLITACAFVLFTSMILPPKIEIKISHQFSRIESSPLQMDIKLNHDFGGNMHKPINFQISDPGYPIRVQVQNR